MPRCDDPNCGCQPAPKKPNVKPPSVNIFLRGTEPEQVHEIHEPESELDVFFDMIQHIMTIREITRSPETRKATRVTYLKQETKGLQFVNLHGLADNSIALKLRMKESVRAVHGHKMRMRVKHFGFVPIGDSNLYTDMYCCDWNEQNIEIIIPAKRCHGWTTVALILATFRRISKEQWSLMVNMAGAPDIAGLDWKKIESELWPDKEEPKNLNSVNQKGKMPIAA